MLRSLCLVSLIFPLFLKCDSFLFCCSFVTVCFIALFCFTAPFVLPQAHCRTHVISVSKMEQPVRSEISTIKKHSMPLNDGWCLSLKINEASFADSAEYEVPSYRVE